MKLSNLNGQIRKQSEKIAVGLRGPDGRTVVFRVPRSSVLEGLKESFPEGGQFETGWYINDFGELRTEGGDGSPLVPGHYPGDAPSQVIEDALVEDDDEDLLGDDTPAVSPASAYDDDDLLA